MLEYDRKKLGTYLKEVREQAAYTQADVSTKLGYTSPQFISNIERGISVIPLKTLARMISLYKVNPEGVTTMARKDALALERRDDMRKRSDGEWTTRTVGYRRRSFPSWLLPSRRYVTV